MANTILLTGSSGTLGRAISHSQLFPSLLTPSRKELDITCKESVSTYFSAHDFDTILNCAALARMKLCEEQQSLAIQTNIIGTALLASETASKQKQTGKTIRFLHLSTDGVYEGSTGNYQEDGPTLPYNTYGLTKLGGEFAVRTLPNHCIIRTSFFDTTHIPFDTAATDSYSSKMPLPDLVKAIHLLASHPFIGVINVGEERASEYDRYKRYKPSIAPCSFKEIQDATPFPLAKDASLDLQKWNFLKRKIL